MPSPTVAAARWCPTPYGIRGWCRPDQSAGQWWYRKGAQRLTESEGGAALPVSPGVPFRLRAHRLAASGDGAACVRGCQGVVGCPGHCGLLGRKRGGCAVVKSGGGGVNPRRVPIHYLVTHLMRARTAMVGPAVPDPGADDSNPMRTTKRSSGFQIAHIGMEMANNIYLDE